MMVVFAALTWLAAVINGINKRDKNLQPAQQRLIIIILRTNYLLNNIQLN